MKKEMFENSFQEKTHMGNRKAMGQRKVNDVIKVKPSVARARAHHEVLRKGLLERTGYKNEPCMLPVAPIRTSMMISPHECQTKQLMSGSGCSYLCCTRHAREAGD